MKLLPPGEQFACNYDFGRHTLRFEGKVNGEPVYQHADGDGRLVVKRRELWYDTGHTDITALRASPCFCGAGPYTVYASDLRTGKSVMMVLGDVRLYGAFDYVDGMTH